MGWLRATATLVDESSIGPTIEVPEDEQDSYLTTLAFSCDARYLVSLDQHLLDMTFVREEEMGNAVSRILTPGALLEELGLREV